MSGRKEQLTAYTVEGRKGSHPALRYDPLVESAAQFTDPRPGFETQLNPHATLSKHVKGFFASLPSEKVKIIPPESPTAAQHILTPSTRLTVFMGSFFRWQKTQYTEEIRGWSTALDTWRTKKTAEPLFSKLQLLTGVTVSPYGGRHLVDENDNHLVIEVRQLNFRQPLDMTSVLLARGDDRLSVAFSSKHEFTVGEHGGIFNRDFSMEDLSTIVALSLQTLASGVNKLNPNEVSLSDTSPSLPA